MKLKIKWTFALIYSIVVIKNCCSPVDSNPCLRDFRVRRVIIEQRRAAYWFSLVAPYLCRLHSAFHSAFTTRVLLKSTIHCICTINRLELSIYLLKILYILIFRYIALCIRVLRVYVKSFISKMIYPETLTISKIYLTPKVFHIHNIITSNKQINWNKLLFVIDWTKDIRSLVILTLERALLKIIGA